MFGFFYTFYSQITLIYVYMYTSLVVAAVKIILPGVHMEEYTTKCQSSTVPKYKYKYYMCTCTCCIFPFIFPKRRGLSNKICEKSRSLKCFLNEGDNIVGDISG